MDEIDARFHPRQEQSDAAAIFPIPVRGPSGKVNVPRKRKRSSLMADKNTNPVPKPPDPISEPIPQPMPDPMPDPTPDPEPIPGGTPKPVRSRRAQAM